MADVAERLRAADLEPGPARRSIDLDWAAPGDRARAHLLHRLALLGLPGIAREGRTAPSPACRGSASRSCATRTGSAP
ncbi:DUF5682 family protein [Methylobacterium sp. 092160098-2]|uniref:DUF5682 family protein n=1 Tax=Methylobacterium sp. 092160098-2 TaxID=3025129 RepID=UPI002381B654|nr:DUF5682 family protein [Methylobacterium sp. 092160098-2]MDE4913940.1 DUF5682 family protein [Methylobacterium sp. 092160098-2]